MNAFDCILDGLEQALELERELGVRTVEIDRALLADAKSPVSGLATSPRKDVSRETPDVRREDTRRQTPDANQPISQSTNRRITPLVFLHDRPLSPKGVEMVEKIVQALGLTAESAPVVVAPPVPKAKVVVVLGGLALKKYLPGMRGEPGQWLRTPKGTDVLVTYSPEYILRFATVTPAVLKIKQDMWRSLKAVKQRMLLV